jgi:hypothetical protein
VLDEPRRIEVTRRLGRSLDVAERAIAAFGAAGYEDAENPALDVGGDKVVAETAMLLHAVSRSHISPAIRDRVQELAGSLVPLARSDEALARVALRPSLAEVLSVPHVLLTRLGYPDAEVDSFLRYSVASLGSRTHELPPYGALEKLWIRELWGLPTDADMWRGAFRGSVVEASLDLVGGMREDYYAFTHGLMYATDFGASSRSLPRPVPAVLDDARAVLAVCVDTADYDIVGEMLMAWPFVRTEPCATARFVFALLQAVEDEAGLLPGGTTSVDRLASLEGEPRRLYALATAYHTAYVMGMLCAVWSEPAGGRVPLTPTRSPDVDELIADNGFAIEHRDVARVLSTLSDSEYAELGAFRLDLVVAQAVRNRQFGPLAELVRRVAASGYPTSPLLKHAEELLVRLALGLSSRAAPHVQPATR